MTYPPGGSGYPPAQPASSSGSSAPAATDTDGAQSQLPMYLTIVVAALGLVAYLASFGPMYDTDSPLGSSSVAGSWFSTAALLAGLLAGVSLLPKAKNYAPLVGVLAVLGALLVIPSLFDAPEGVSIGWGLWLVLAVAIVQAGVAVAALLLDAGVITAPPPRPKYDPYQYGPPSAAYYGQPGQPGQPGQTGYPAQYGGGYPSSSGGYGAPSPQQGQPQGQPQGPHTPPTGFPSFSPPPGVGQEGPGYGQGGPGQQAPPPPGSPQS